MVKPAERWTKKYEARTSVALPDYEWGLKHPTRDPVEGAIAGKPTLKAKMSASETWDKWEDALKFVGGEGVIRAALEKGGKRYVDGVRYGLPKQRDFAGKFAAHLEAAEERIQKMPKVTIEDSVAKAAEQIRHNAKFVYKKGR